jgi:molybdopterin molybdotransferase
MRREHAVFILPGNPVSVLVTFELLVRPAVNALQGLLDPLPRYHRGRLAAPVRRNERRHEFLRARTRRERDGVALEPLAGQESHMIVRAAPADALVSLEPGPGELPAGETVPYLPL